MRCDICGEDKTGIVMIVDQEGRQVVCPDCTRLMPTSFWNRDEPQKADDLAGYGRIRVKRRPGGGTPSAGDGFL